MYFSAVAGRHPRRAGPTWSPGGAASHAVGHTTWIVM